MFNVGPLELIVVLIIALIVLGPQRLPEVARSVGRGMREFRNSLEGHGDDEDFEDEVHEPEALTPGPHEPDAEPDPGEPHAGAHVAEPAAPATKPPAKSS